MSPQRRPTPIASRHSGPVSTPEEARKLSDDLLNVMTELLGIIENETAFVRAGKIREAMALESTKSELSRRYISAIGKLESSQDFLVASVPELLEALRLHHNVFRSMLQVNVTVLATAHAVSEGIIRGVNGEMRKKNMPQTYTASGRRTLPNPRRAEPLAVSRIL